MSFALMGQNSPLLDTSFLESGYLQQWRGLPGPELKEPIRKQLAIDTERYLQSGNKITILDFPITTSKKNKRKTHRTRTRKALAKLTPEQAKEIKIILSCKTNVNYKTFAWVAQEYGITGATVRALWLGKTWKDIA